MLKMVITKFNITDEFIIGNQVGPITLCKQAVSYFHYKKKNGIFAFKRTAQYKYRSGSVHRG